MTETSDFRRHMPFIAPEAIISKQNIEPANDVFSWAAAAYHLIEGDHTRSASIDISPDDQSSSPDFFSSVHEHSTRAPPDLSTIRPSIPAELSDIIRKARSLDPDDRYRTISSLLHDLNKVKDICSGTLRSEKREQFGVGHVDDRSRFKIPPGILDREEEYAELDRELDIVRSTGVSQVVCCWGRPGTGKTKLLETWAGARESETATGQDVLVGWAKVNGILFS